MNKEKLGKKLFVNALTLSRHAFSLLAIPVVISGNIPAAVIMLTLAGLTDIADGGLAKYWKVESKLGGINDAIADGVFWGSLIFTILSIKSYSLIPASIAFATSSLSYGLIRIGKELKKTY